MQYWFQDSQERIQQNEKQRPEPFLIQYIMTDTGTMQVVEKESLRSKTDVEGPVLGLMHLQLSKSGLQHDNLERANGKAQDSLGKPHQEERCG